MAIELTGVITAIFPTEQYGSFWKKVFWLAEADPSKKYPNTWALELWHDDGIALINPFRAGDVVRCSIDIVGKHWKKQSHSGNKEGVINTLKCWNLVKLKPSGAEMQPQDFAKKPPQDLPQASEITAPLDDLPF